MRIQILLVKENKKKMKICVYMLLINTELVTIKISD